MPYSFMYNLTFCKSGMYYFKGEHMGIQPPNSFLLNNNMACSNISRNISARLPSPKRCFLKRLWCRIPSLRTKNSKPHQTNEKCKSVAIDIPVASVPAKPCLLKRIWSKVPSIKSLIPSPFSTIVKKVWKVVAAILNLGLGLMLYWTNNSLFAIGLVMGMAYYKEVGLAIDNIKAVWKTQPFHTALIAGFGSFLGGAGSFLSLPITIGVGSVLYSANLGANLAKRAQEILKAYASAETKVT